MLEHSPKIIAVAGKGGVGKTSISAAFVRLLTEAYPDKRILANDFDYVVIDGEAGIEQINRPVMEKVTHLVLITDPSRKATQVIDTIKRVADELVMYDRCGAIVNRVTDPALIPYIHINGTEILATIGSDPQHAANDIQGLSVFDLPEDAPVIRGAREALTKLEIL